MIVALYRYFKQHRIYQARVASRGCQPSPHPQLTFWCSNFFLFLLDLHIKKMNEHGTMLRTDSEIEGTGLLQTPPHIDSGK